jgi:hypothetical protein
MATSSATVTTGIFQMIDLTLIAGKIVLLDAAMEPQFFAKRNSAVGRDAV